MHNNSINTHLKPTFKKGKSSLTNCKNYSENSTTNETSFLQVWKIQSNIMTNKLKSKYCTSQNFVILNQINRSISEKQCSLRTTINDLTFDVQEQKLQKYYSEDVNKQISELTQYYKYYSQRSLLFQKQFFILLYQYQERRKVVEYNRLKVLLSLSGTEQESQLGKGTRQKCSENKENSTNMLRNKNEKFDYRNCNVLSGLDQNSKIQVLQTEQSYLLDKLRRNLSKHIGSNGKSSSVQELDKFYNFSKKNDIFNQVKHTNAFFGFKVTKKNTLTTKNSKEATYATTTPDNQKFNPIRKKSNRNKSCQNLIKYQKSIDNRTKIRRKKNLSMDNMNFGGFLEHQKKQIKIKKASTSQSNCHNKRTNTQKNKKQKQEQNYQNLLDSINVLKNKIKKQKQRYLKSTTSTGCTTANNFCYGPTTGCNTPSNQKRIYNSNNPYNSENSKGCNFISKYHPAQLSSNAYQRFSKKNYQKLKQKIV